MSCLLTLLTLLQLSFELLQPRLVFVSVVAAEEKLSAGREDRAYLGCRAATVATIGSGQIGAGECGCHGSSPSVPAPVARCPRIRMCPRVAITGFPAFTPSTLADVCRFVSVPGRSSLTFRL